MNKLKFLPDLSGSAAIRMDLLWEVNHGFCYNGPLDSHILLGFFIWSYYSNSRQDQGMEKEHKKDSKVGEKVNRGILIWSGINTTREWCWGHGRAVHQRRAGPLWWQEGSTFGWTCVWMNKKLFLMLWWPSVKISRKKGKTKQWMITDQM